MSEESAKEKRYCSTCGKEIDLDAKFCPFCLDEKSSSSEGAEEAFSLKPVQLDSPSDADIGIIAMISLILGIMGIAFCIIPIIQFYGLFLGIIGIIFGSLGLKEKGTSAKVAKIGLVCSIIAVALSIVLFVALIYFVRAFGNIWGV